jgi:hypothetical protein
MGAGEGMRSADQWNDIGRLGGKPVRQLLIVRNQMSNVDVAEVSLDQDILANLVTAEHASKVSNMRRM